jgi:3-deoxy-D-manno-octulosonic-acid transferase
VIRLIYNLVWPLGLLLFLPGYLIKMFRRGGYRRKFGQRLGFYDADVRALLAQRTSAWLHAVSVGEVAIAFKLASQLRALQSDLHCVLTTTTTTGFAFATKNTPPWIEVMYSPLDFWPVMWRAFSAIRPAKIVLVEAEVWPNLVAEARARKIPIALVNARLSPRSERRFRRFQRFVAPTFRLLDLVCVPEAEDVERWRALGVEQSRIRNVGSIKYDPENVKSDPTAPEKVLRQLKIENRNPVILGGSTHRGEEEILAQIFLELRAGFPNLLLIVAPRHAERAREIQRSLRQLGLTVALRSEAVAGVQSPDCLLLDSTGELRNWYPVATIVFIGKSLITHGGQNPAEAIVAGRPVVFGPHMENFAAFAQLLVREQAAMRINSAAELQATVANLLRDAALRERLMQNGQRVLQVHRGAAARTAALISNLSVAPRSGALQCAE